MEVKREPKIFISYRRDDAAGFATLLDQKLGEHFGEDNVFRDLSDIPGGTHFEQDIKEQIKSCDILLAVIGKDWLATTKKKIENEEKDFVRLEIATALSQRPSIVVVPLLVQGAQFPLKQDLPEDLGGLVELQYSELSHKWWKQDTSKLIKELEKAFEKSNKTKTNVVSAAVDSRTPAGMLDPHKARVRNSRLSFFGGSGAGLLSGAVVGAYYAYYASTNTEWWRPGLAAGYAFVVGVVMSGSIN